MDSGNRRSKFGELDDVDKDISVWLGARFRSASYRWWRHWIFPLQHRQRGKMPGQYLVAAEVNIHQSFGNLERRCTNPLRSNEFLCHASTALCRRGRS